MPRYSYKAVNTSGQIQEGELQANNVDDLESRLNRMGMELIKYRDKAPLFTFSLFGASHRRVARQELIVFCFYLEQLIRSGVPLLEGLTDLRDSLGQSYFKEIISSLVEDIEGGQRLSEAMSRFPKVFNNVFISLIQVGEASGKLDTVFKHLSDNLKWQDELIEQTKKLLLYPSFVAFTIVCTVAFMMIYLVPQLVGFIKSMGYAMPLHTRLLLATSNVFVHYWYVLLGLPLALAGLVVAGRRFSYRVHYATDKIRLRLWLIGPITEKIILARFASFFALMYSAGITVLESLKSTQGFADNLVVEEALRRVHEHISDGGSITESFAKANLFPPLVLRMVSIGETTGELDAALNNVSYFYGREVKESIAKLQTLIQPLLTAVLGLIMAWVMFSVLGPIYDIMSKISP